MGDLKRSAKIMEYLFLILCITQLIAIFIGLANRFPVPTHIESHIKIDRMAYAISTHVKKSTKPMLTKVAFPWGIIAGIFTSTHCLYTLSKLEPTGSSNVVEFSFFTWISLWGSLLYMILSLSGLWSDFSKFSLVNNILTFIPSFIFLTIVNIIDPLGMVPFFG